MAARGQRQHELGERASGSRKLPATSTSAKSRCRGDPHRQRRRGDVEHPAAPAASPRIASRSEMHDAVDRDRQRADRRDQTEDGAEGEDLGDGKG